MVCIVAAIIGYTLGLNYVESRVLTDSAPTNKVALRDDEKSEEREVSASDGPGSGLPAGLQVFASDAPGPGVPAEALVEVYTDAAEAVAEAASASAEGEKKRAEHRGIEYTVTTFEAFMNDFSEYVNARASPSALVPFSFQTAPGAKESTLTILNIIGFKVPVWLQYVYPLAFFGLLVIFWFVCCGAGVRKASAGKLNGKLICETVMCYACLWADLASEHKVMKVARAWSYIIMLVLLATLWNLFLVLYDDAKTKHIIHLVFAPLVCFVWIVFAVERAFARKFFSRVVDKMSAPNFCVDFLVHLFCAPYAILEEAKFLPQAQPTVQYEKTAW